MAQPYKKTIPIVAPSFRVTRGAKAKYQGNQMVNVAVATFDPSANTAQRPVAAYGLGVYIPTKAVITKVWVDVVTTFTSAGADAGTIALHIQAADDVVAAVAISAAGDVWDAGIHGSKIGYPNFGADAAHDSAVEVAALFAAAMLKTTAEREITATVAEQALTAGKATDFSVVLFRSTLMLFSEKNRMKVHKNQWLLTMLYPLVRLAGATSRGQTMAPEGQKPSKWLYLTKLPREMYPQPIVHKALSWGAIRKSACILAEITIRKSQANIFVEYVISD